MTRRFSTSSDSSTEETEQTEPEKPAVVFPVIVDVFGELAANNPLPFLTLLEKKDESVNVTEKDQNGYNAFHYLIMSGNYALVKFLSADTPAFLGEKTDKAQTNLMIAVNQRNYSVFSHVLAHSSDDLTSKDAYGFNVFFYTVRNNSITVFFKLLNAHITRLLNQEVGIGEAFAQSPLANKDRDNSGCTLLHWAAFRDSLFLLKFMFRFHADFGQKDKEGRVPFERATQNNAVRCVEFMLTSSHYPYMTNYFLYGSFEPVEFDFLPASPGKALADHHSPFLRNTFKRLRTAKASTVERATDIYRKYNLKFRFGALGYMAWSLGSLTAFVSNTQIGLECLATYIVHLLTLVVAVWFYT